MLPSVVSITEIASIYLVSFLPLWIPFDSLPSLQFNDLQECYLRKRRHSTDKPHSQQERDTNLISREGYSAGLEDFQSVLTTFTHYRYCCQVLFYHLQIPIQRCNIDVNYCFVESAIHSYLQHFFGFIWNRALRVIAELRHGDLFHSANIVSRWVVFWSFS